MFSIRFFAAHLVCVWVFATGVASALPTEFHQEGWVVDANGRAIEGLHRVEITLYDGRGQRLFSETHARVEFTQGYYSLRIGSIDDLDPNDFILDEVTVAFPSTMAMSWPPDFRFFQCLRHWSRRKHSTLWGQSTHRRFELPVMW